MKKLAFVAVLAAVIIMAVLCINLEIQQRGGLDESSEIAVAEEGAKALMQSSPLIQAAGQRDFLSDGPIKEVEFQVQEQETKKKPTGQVIFKGRLY